MSQEQQTPDNNTQDVATLTARFNNIVRKAQTAIFIERAVPKIMPPLYVTGIFLAASWAGVWGYLPPAARMAGVLTLAAMTLASPRLVKTGSLIVRKDDAYKRIDSITGDPTRPAQTLGDRPDANSPQAAKDLWDRHLTDTWNRWGDALQPGRARPDINAFDRFKLRYAVAATVALSAALAGDEHLDRLKAAFDWTTPATSIVEESAAPLAALKLNGWITPPDGLNKDPVYLSESGGDTGRNGEKLTAHKNSTLTIVTYDREAAITVNGTAVPLKRAIAARAATQSRQTFEYSVTLSPGETSVQVEGGPSWNFVTGADNDPTVKIDKVAAGKNESEQTVLQLNCSAKDDFGVTEGEVIITAPSKDPRATPLESAKIPPVSLPAPNPCL